MKGAIAIVLVAAGLAACGDKYAADVHTRTSDRDSDITCIRLWRNGQSRMGSGPYKDLGVFCKKEKP